MSASKLGYNSLLHLGGENRATPHSEENSGKDKISPGDLEEATLLLSSPGGRAARALLRQPALPLTAV